MIYFSKANTKLKKLQKKLKRKVYSLDLLAGWSCPFAKDCKSMVVGDICGLKILDGPQCKFRCYSASQEAVYRHVFLNRLKNFQAIKSLAGSHKKIANLISRELPKDCGVLRWHVSGDFFCKNYMKAAILVAEERSDIEFYGYTKAIKFYNELYSSMPSNFRLIASLGGTQDKYIQPFMKTARVVNSNKEAKSLKLRIDYNDYLAYSNATNFSLLIHGIQPSCLKSTIK